MDSAVEIEFRELCRICANPRGQDIMIPIFEKDGIKIKLWEKMNTYLPINVYKDDGFPDQVCISCTSKLNVYDQLLQTCRDADARLLALKKQLDIEAAELQLTSLITKSKITENEIKNDSTFGFCDSAEQKFLLPSGNLSLSAKASHLGTDDQSADMEDVHSVVDSKISVILPGKKVDNAQTTRQPNIVVVKVPREESCDAGFLYSQDGSGSRESDDSDMDRNNDVLDKNLDDNQLRQVIAEAQLMQMQAAENFLRALEENLDEPPSKSKDRDRKKRGIPPTSLKGFKRKRSSRTLKVPKHRQEVHENSLVSSVNMSRKGGSDVRRSQRKRIKNKFYDSDTEITPSACSYDCKLCNRVFLNSSGLRVHTKGTFHKLQLERLFCLSCNQKFHDVNAAKEHECKDERKFECQLCGLAFDTAQETELHKLEHSNGPFTCAICNDQFNNLLILQDHIIQHTKDKPYQCNYCGKMFKSLIGLQGHLIRHTNSRTYVCYICHTPFSNRDEMRAHRLKHGDNTRKTKQEIDIKRFPCELCGKALTSKAGLIVHLRIHTGEKPFECDQCGHRFRQSIKLRYHQRLHAGNLPYVCSLCKKRFNTQRQMDTHMRVHTNERPYICEICGMRFRSNGVLSRHKNTHSAEPLFSCSICGKRFRTRHATTVHERTHTGDKRFMCDVCGRAFVQKFTLEKHRLRHEKQKVECLECNTSFATRKGLRKHFEKKHTQVFVESIQMIDPQQTQFVSVPMDDLVVEVVV